ncbi:MAG: hypothetical protein CMP50_04475 [Flavobacteriales bacterium]|mgnify:FL=1|nr:hypothetical protein [Flavobacteriales bacterium]|tara:strand:- start:2788 stop:3375 length:588 start_codon:yes stop_codon:yes gene_type:complete
MKNLLLTILICFAITTSYAQDNIVGVGFTNFSNISINYEKQIHSELNLKLSFSRNLLNGEKSKRKITYNFSSLSAKMYGRDIFGFDFYHGPGVLVGFYYEYMNFNKNNSYYPITNITFDAIGTDDNNPDNFQNSSFMSPQYQVGLERDFGGFFVSGELGLGAHYLFNDYMTILDRYNMGSFVPHIWFSLFVTYNY